MILIDMFLWKSKGNGLRRLLFKQDMWRVDKHTGKEVYNEVLNAATNEVRKSRQNVEHKLAPNIKSDSIKLE